MYMAIVPQRSIQRHGCHKKAAIERNQEESTEGLIHAPEANEHPDKRWNSDNHVGDSGVDRGQ